MITSCHVCGLVVETDIANDISKYICPRCHAVILRDSNMKYVFAFSLTSLILMIPSMIFPFLIIQINDSVMSANLFESVIMLSRDGFTAAGVVVLCVSFVFPVIYLMLTAYTAFDSLSHQRLPKAGYAAFIIEKFQSWQMVDVFLVGILVSVVKLVDMADVTLGRGFYSLLGACFFMVCSGIYYDSRYYWRIKKNFNR